MSDTPQGPGWWLASDGKYYAPQPQASMPSSASSRPPQQVPGWLLIGGWAACFVGAFLPWATISAPFVGTVSKAGTSGDGVITLVFSGVAGAFAIALYRGSRRTGFVITSLVLAVLTLAIAIYDGADVTKRLADAKDLPVSGSIGIGLWLTGLGAAAALAGSIMWLRLVRRRETPEPSF